MQEYQQRGFVEFGAFGLERRDSLYQLREQDWLKSD